MIAYKIQIVIDEEHEEDFEEILKNIYDHIEKIEGITEVQGDPESYFEYNEDINFEEEEDDRTDQEIVDIIKSSKTAKFSYPGMGCQELPTERIKFLIDAWEKRREKRCLKMN